jgi:hypothetical protein
MAMARNNQVKVVNCISAAKPFRQASMKGGPDTGLGRLPEEWRRKFYGDAPTYVVYSYQTPIGWRTAEGEWVIPGVRYSATTRLHQRLVFEAVGHLASAAA